MKKRLFIPTLIAALFITGLAMLCSFAASHHGIIPALAIALFALALPFPNLYSHKLGALQYSVGVRNARLDVVESTIGASAILKIYDLTAGAPADCAAAITGTILATCALPSDYMAAASGGTKAKSGTWEDASADASGTADFFRLFASDGTTCHAQGTITSTATGTGDMLIDNPVFVAGQAFTINTFTLTAGNA